MTVPSIEPIKLVAKIVQTYMAIADGSIMLGLENWQIPDKPGLYIALTYGPDTILGSNTSYVANEDDGVDEVNQVSVMHTVDLDVMSFDSTARLRRFEILQALTSDYAQGLMEQHNMRIANVPNSFVAVPTLEETKQLNRYRISFAVYAAHVKAKATPYYDVVNPPEVTPNA